MSRGGPCTSVRLVSVVEGERAPGPLAQPGPRPLTALRSSRVGEKVPSGLREGRLSRDPRPIRPPTVWSPYRNFRRTAPETPPPPPRVSPESGRDPGSEGGTGSTSTSKLAPQVPYPGRATSDSGRRGWGQGGPTPNHLLIRGSGRSHRVGLTPEYFCRDRPPSTGPTGRTPGRVPGYVCVTRVCMGTLPMYVWTPMSTRSSLCLSRGPDRGCLGVSPPPPS